MALKLNKEDIIQRIISVHGNKYDLSKVNYLNKRTKIILICSIHGPWNSLIEQIMRGQGCPVCGKNNAAKKRRLSFDDFVIKANEIHGNRYEYFRESYIKSSLKTNIRCLDHGEFNQIPSNHIGVQKQGCPECGFIEQVLKRKMPLTEFINKANKIHSNRYDYSQVEFNNQKDFIKISCKKHGLFIQNLSNHLTGSGCPDCNNSKGENKVKEILIKHKIIFVQQKTFEGLKDLSLLKCDFYLPKYKCVIEYNGRQHYEPINTFGGEMGLLETKKRDDIKRAYLTKNKIKLIEIHYKTKDIEQFILESMSISNRL